MYNNLRKLAAEDDKKIKIPSTILGSLLSLVGGSTTTRSVQDLLHAVKDYKAPALSHKIKGGFKPGDIILHGDSGDEWIKFDKQIMGHPFRQHASIVIQHPETGKLVVVPPTHFGGKSVPWAGLKGVIRHLKRTGLKGLKDIPDKWQKSEHFSDVLGKPLTDTELAKRLSAYASPKEFLRNSGMYDVLRTKKPLTEAELVKVMKNLQETGNYTVLPSDIYGTGVKSVFTPIVNRKRGISKPTICAGGVCNLYSGVRRMPSPSTTMPSDLAKNREFTHIMRRHAPGTLGDMPTRQQIFGKALGGAGLKGTLGLGLAIPGLYLLNRGVRNYITGPAGSET